jgi:hypothetical protein
LKVYLRAEGEIAKRFLKIKEHLGLKNYTEVVRALINEYWRDHEEEITKSERTSKKG